LGPMLPRMEPPPHPARAWPHRRHGVAQARGPVGRERHGRLEAALAQSAPHLPTTLSACPVGGRQTAPPLPSIPTDAPDPQETRCTPPAAPRLIDGLHTPRRAVIATEGTGPQRLRRVRQAVGEVTHRTLRDHQGAARVLPRARHGAWDLPPADISTIRRGSTSLGLPRAAHRCERGGARRPRPGGRGHRKPPAAVCPVPSSSPWRSPWGVGCRSSRLRPRASLCSCSRASWSPRAVESRTRALHNASPLSGGSGPLTMAQALAPSSHSALSSSPYGGLLLLGGAVLHTPTDLPAEGSLVLPLLLQGL
jgi:hypothetical protein